MAIPGQVRQLSPSRGSGSISPDDGGKDAVTDCCGSDRISPA
ncbi:hypothetical protein ACH4SP_04625 [Streptomyces sp. NPDC021093]